MRHIVIPARFASTRFPGKPLELLHGKPMILHVADRALTAVKSGVADDMCIATDDERIAKICQTHGHAVVMTASSHTSGTDRLAEVVQVNQWSENDMVINIQGDEPLIPVELVAQVAQLLQNKTNCDMATLCEPMTESEMINNTSVVKVVCSNNQEALYFSRAVIPHVRDQQNLNNRTCLRHLGLYAYRVKLLKDFVSWDVGTLEQLESLEQLRVLENGRRIAIEQAVVALPAGVDTPEDLKRLNSMSPIS